VNAGVAADSTTQNWYRDGAVGLILAVQVLMFMLPFIRPPTGNEVLIGHDLLNQQYPLYSLIFDSVRAGNGLPMWNPYPFGGQSITANPQSTIYYPPAWIMAVMGVPRGVGWLVTLHLWLGGLGMAAFTRQLGASRMGALAGGIIYAFSGVMGAHLYAGHINYLLCAAWLPWVVTGYGRGMNPSPHSRSGDMHLRSARPPRTRRGGGICNKTVLDISLSRLSQNVFRLLPGAAAFGMCILTGYPPLLYFGVVWLVVMAVYAVKIRRTTWVGAVRSLAVIVVIGGMLGAAMLMPVAEFTLRSTRTDGSLWFSNSFAMPPIQLPSLLIPNLFGEPRGGYWGVPFYEELTAYIGILPLAAIFILRRSAAAVLLTGFMIVGVVVSLGVEGGLFTLLYYLLPGYSLFRVPSRSLYFFMVGGAGLAALLISGLQKAASSKHSGLAGAWIAGIVIVIMLADIWRVSRPLVQVGAVDVPEMWKTMSQIAPASPEFRVMTVPNHVDWQTGAAYTRHLNAGGYDPLVNADYQRLVEASGYNPTSPIARLLGVRYLISNRAYEFSGLSGLESLISKTEKNGWTIYEIADPLPRTFITADMQVIPDDETALTMLAEGDIDPLQTAVLSEAIDCPAGKGGEAKITDYRPNQVTITTQSDAPGILVLTDSYEPNWTVTVDGAPAQLVRVYTALRGICVPAGAHEVVFRYEPGAFQIGVIISVISWSVVVAMGGFMMVRRMRRHVETG
jgi:hypothetical protein